MAFFADLHLHSKYSRATSKDCDLEHLALWAQKKGLALIGTGDFTHPAWMAEIRNKLVPAGTGVFKLQPNQEKFVNKFLPPACNQSTRFLLTVEISTIYKKGDRTRKVHHVILAPSIDAAEALSACLAKIGNLRSDGRPILGLDSRDLLEITLDNNCSLIPAHIWTPWFSALGSRSGFDSIEQCYCDLVSHIFALETGLSSDPAMNWRVSELDKYRLVSNSDAHSPAKLGREATAFECAIDYFSICQALKTGVGYMGTVEFFPEEGKYYFDGHRKCGIRLSPAETYACGGCCPVCGKPVTIGVMHRVEDLADKEDAYSRPATAGEVRSLIPLPEILSEIQGVGSTSKKVSNIYESLLGRLGPELVILNELPLEEIKHAVSGALSEAISRLRRGQVIREPGYDGKYGVIHVFKDAELAKMRAGGLLFEIPERLTQSNKAVTEKKQVLSARVCPTRLDLRQLPQSKPQPKNAFDPLAELDKEQRQAVEITNGPLLIVAGPGAGKTKTLTHRIAFLVAKCGVDPKLCLVITFTRRAAEELCSRLHSLLPSASKYVSVNTFHGLGFSILKEYGQKIGLSDELRIADDAERIEILKSCLYISSRKARGILAKISKAKQSTCNLHNADLTDVWSVYERELAIRNLLDLDDLVLCSVRLLQTHPSLIPSLQKQYAWVCVDEYQDIDEQQLRLLQLLIPCGGNLCVIGDPNQAIYGFRGANVEIFHRFSKDFPGARVITLKHNYRSVRPIVDACSQVIQGNSSLSSYHIEALRDSHVRIVVHSAPTERAEAEFVVHCVEQMIGGKSFFSFDTGRLIDEEREGVAFSDFAVLYRLDAQSNALCEAFQRSGIPYQKRNHERLLARPGVREIVEELRVSQAGTGPVLDSLQRVGEILREKSKSSSMQVLITDALDILKPFAAKYGDNLERFLSALTLETDVDTWDERAARVSLLTLHASKGLEFKVVFIVGCEHGIIPLKIGGESNTDLDEERRLFFVGMTRAKTHLFLCHSNKRLWRGKVRLMHVSPFLDSIKKDLLEHQKSQLPTRGPSTKKQLDLF